MHYVKTSSGTTDIVDPLSGLRDNNASEELIFASKLVEKFLATNDFTYLGNGFGKEISRYVWCYWGQGFENAPDIVKACNKTIQLRNQDRNVILLNDENLSQYIDIPDIILQHEGISKTHFSDILRVLLLKKYGGTWIDATCWSRLSVTNISKIAFSVDLLENYQRANFFAFTAGNFLSNWFLISSKDHVIPTIMSEYLVWYWSQYESEHHYFMFHLAFRAFYLQNAAFRRTWDRTTPISSKSAHILQNNLNLQFHAATFEHLLDASPIHKLTYKSEPKEANGTILQHLCNHQNIR